LAHWALGCGSTSPTPPAAGAAAAQAAQAVDVLTRAAVAADDVVGLSGVIDPTADATTIAHAIAAHATGSFASCGTVALTGAAGTTVSVTLPTPPPTGCPTGAAGQASAAVAVQSGVVTIAVTFTAFDPGAGGGLSLSGAATWVTANGSSFQLGGSLSAGMAVSPSLSLLVTDTGMVFDGTAQALPPAGSPLPLVLRAVHMAPGECYPDAGGVALPGLGAEVDYGPLSPATGQAQLIQGASTTALTLPQYGECPPNATVDAGVGVGDGRGSASDAASGVDGLSDATTG
jgi:hypothetical protein